MVTDGGREGGGRKGEALGWGKDVSVRLCVCARARVGSGRVHQAG